MNSHTNHKKIVLPIFLCIAFLSFKDAKAQGEDTLENHLTVSAQLRTRFELRDGAFRPLATGEKPAAFFSDRIRFSTDYSFKKKVTIRISPQTVSVWGQANMVQGAENSANRIAMFEAWTKLQLSELVNIKIGRQVISLDDERFFGELDWAQGARAHDAVSINLNKNKLEVKSFLAFNQNYKTLYGNNLSNASGNLYSITDAFPYKWMQTLWAGFPLGEKSKISVLATNLGFQNATITTKDTTIYDNQTFGANFFHNNEKISATVSAYYQCGQNNAGTNTQAYMAVAYIGYNANAKLHIGLGSDLLSGNNVGTPQTKNNVFNPYFHTGHKFYGNMDYYYSGNAHKNTGLSDSYLKFIYKANKNLAVNIVAHQFITPNSVQSAAKAYNSNLGEEIDLSFSYKVNKFATFVGGYSFYSNTETVNFLKNTPKGKNYQQWAWLSLNITPTFFKTKF